MLITSIVLKQFRCFTAKTLTLSKPIVIIEGPNGSGKTSIVEALYYSCYLRSFKTRTPRELIRWGEEAFSIKIATEQRPHNNTPDAPAEKIDITVGYSPEKRLIKVNNTAAQSYRDLVAHHRVITFTDDDRAIIKGSPDTRRLFLDQSIVLVDSDYATLLKKYIGVLVQRNALLNSTGFSRDSYMLWTQQLLDITTSIRHKRCALLVELEHETNRLLEQFFDAPYLVSLTYKPRDLPENKNMTISYQETKLRRTLFGAHLDDWGIMLDKHASKVYASKGQQKLVAMLIKLSQPATKNAGICSFLLDDALSDLDYERLRTLFELLVSYKTQLIVTSPLDNPLLSTLCSSHDHEKIKLTT